MYDIWYCPLYPVDAINVSNQVDRTGRDEWRAALAENIQQCGLVNPLIVLNHRGDKAKDHWLMTGTNRHWAVKHLGMTTVPAIVTGECEFEPKIKVELENLQSYFPDGEVYIGTHGPRLRGVCKPEDYVYPSSKGISDDGSVVRDEVRKV